MDQVKDGGPAFPRVVEQPNGYMQAVEGMTLRDYFAAKAMQAALHGACLPGLTHGAPETVSAVEEMARGVYVIADAMLKAREANHG